MVDLRRELGDLPNGYVVALIVNAADYVQTCIDVLRVLLNEKKLSGIFVTTNRPCENIFTLLKSNGIDTEKLFGVDIMSQLVLEKSGRTKECLFVSSPESLTELSIALTQAVQAMPGNAKFVFLDNATTLLVYNAEETVARFIHALTIKIRAWGAVGVLVSLEKETDEKFFSQLSQFSDKVIVVNGSK